MGPVREVAFFFLRLGFTAFGGPAAHIALMERELVQRRRWITSEEFVDFLGAASLIPGPTSTEMAIHIGHRRAGWPGLVLGGVCFIAPAMVMVMALGWAYLRFGSLPDAKHVLYGIKPVIIGVVGQALWTLARTAVKTWFLGVVLVAATAATVAGAPELAVLLAAGLVAALARRPGLVAVLPGAALVGAAPASFGLGKLFLVLLKIGSVLFGSGYVLLAFLRADFVERLHWLTEAQLLDAVAVGQITPGPVLSTATFIGYLLGGPLAAVVATVAIFLPAFVFVAVSRPLLPRVRRSAVAGAALDGINAASLALMAVVTWHLAREAIVDVPSALLAIVATAVLVLFQVNPIWLILIGAAVGFVAG